MNKNKKNLLLFGFVAIVFVVGFLAFKDSLPQEKNERVYTMLKPHLPYEIEKRVGGFAVKFKDGKEKEKPSNAQLFKYTDSLDKSWGKEFLLLEENTLTILDKDRKIVKKFEISKSENEWIKSFFEL